jgi:hypothetical protein
MRIRRIVFTLIFSPVLLVAVSWLCAWGNNIKPTQSDAPLRWHAAVMANLRIPPSGTAVHSGLGVRVRRVWLTSPPFISTTETSAGWPIHCLTGVRVEMGTLEKNLLPWWHRLAPVAQAPWVRRGAERRIPLIPMWPHFAFAWVFWWFTSFVASESVSIAKMALRRRCRLCLACGYPLIGNECPECGART